MNLKTIQTHSSFAGHGYLQHAGAAWSGAAFMQDNVYLILEENEHRDANPIAYGWQLRKAGEPKPIPASMCDIPGLCGNVTRDRIVLRTIGQVCEDVEDDGIVSKDSDPDSR